LGYKEWTSLSFVFFYSLVSNFMALLCTTWEKILYRADDIGAKEFQNFKPIALL
jgi:hypothetical protein